MLSLENVQKIEDFNSENMSCKAKQTAINQAAQISMTRGQFQPFYYYTANNANGSNNIQLHQGYPSMMAMNGIPMMAHPQFAYNFYAAQAMAQQQQGHRDSGCGAGLLNPADQSLLMQKSQTGPKAKKVVTIQNSEDDHGINSKTESGSENGSHSCDMDKHSDSPIKPQKAKKEKARKPVKKVIAVDLPEELQTIEAVTNRCQQYGEILLVRVLKPGKVMPFDLKMYSGKIHDLGRTCCAIIEFENSNAAAATVDAEENNLSMALLQQGADVALYGSQGKATSEHSSEHTHGESGVGSGMRSRSEFNGGSSNRDSMSHHSQEEDSTHDFVEDIKPIQQKIEKTEQKISVVTPVKTGIFRPSFLRNRQQPLLATPPKELEIMPVDEPKVEFLAPKPVVVNESKVIAANNGRVTTALNIKLAVSKPSSNNRNVIKMELTSRKFNFNADEILPAPSTISIGRSSPALLSDPSDELLISGRISEDLSEECEFKQYSKDLLMSLKDCKRASQFPTGLPNIPELFPKF